MADLKIKQLRVALDQFATLYDNCDASGRADALRRLSSALSKADHLTVDEVMRQLQKVDAAH
jgi:hypothetical protein